MFKKKRQTPKNSVCLIDTVQKLTWFKHVQRTAGGEIDNNQLPMCLSPKAQASKQLVVGSPYQKLSTPLSILQGT